MSAGAEVSDFYQRRADEAVAEAEAKAVERKLKDDIAESWSRLAEFYASRGQAAQAEGCADTATAHRAIAAWRDDS